MAHIIKSSYTTKDQDSFRCNKTPMSHDYPDVSNGHVEESLFT